MSHSNAYLILFRDEYSNPLSWIISDHFPVELDIKVHQELIAQGEFPDPATFEDEVLAIRLAIAKKDTPINWLEGLPEIKPETYLPKRFIELNDGMIEIKGGESNAYNIGFITQKRKPESKIEAVEDKNLLSFWAALGQSDSKLNIYRM